MRPSNVAGSGLGTEAAYAVTSFVTPDKLGSFRYGSPVVNLTADATLPGGLGTFGWDDEGVPAQRVELVKEGLFVGYLTSRETAAQLAKLKGWNGDASHSGGAMRASSWNRTYTGMTPQFWRSCDAICNHNHWEVWGTPNCGKGQPSQIARTGHGAAPARFRNVQVGVMKPGS